MRYAELAIHAPVLQTFHYHVPPELDGRLQPGHLVRVGFGTAMQPGIILGFTASSPFQTRPILELLDPQPVLTTMQLALGQWLSATTLTPPGDCLWLMLPPGFTGRSSRRVVLLAAAAAPQDSTEAAILALLHDQSPRLQKHLEQAIGSKALKQPLERLAQRGIVALESILTPPTVKPRLVRTVRLPDVTDPTAPVTATAPRQQRVLEYLRERPYAVDVAEVLAATGADAGVIAALVKKGRVQPGERPLWRDSLADRAYVPSAPLTLTTAQAAAWQAIRAAQQPGAAPRPILLHGVTGSGKTEIYLYAMAEALAQGRQAIYCVPEIALTPQTIRRVAERFPGQVAVVHGSLSSGERYDTWRRARAGELAVIVGTRSALFTPLPDVGLIVLDEEHDHSYKHTPPLNPPFYHARTVAEEMMRLTGGLLLCGSATPAVETFYRAQRGEMQLLQLPGRIGGHRRGRAAPGDGAEARLLPLPPVAMVDMREELKQGHRSIFSRALQQALAGVLARQEQAILFLNRRGQATYVFCRDCGYVATCRRCDMPLTYHREGAALRCHHCGSTQPAPEVCPDCASRRVKYFGAGTQQVEEALRALFPPVRCLRWDADTADAPAKHEALLAQFSAHEADVLIGTQMIAKGLDVPLVTLVGVVNADPGLALPDFRAGERVFQVLTQVAGRAGRGGPGGQVILQTYQPEHPCLVAAAGHDYAAFYSREIAARRALGYPPFRRLARLLIQHTHPVQAQREAEEAAGLLQARLHLPAAGDSALIGPAPCFFTRVDRHYRWQVLLRSPDPLPLLRDLPLRPGWTLDIDPLEVL